MRRLDKRERLKFPRIDPPMRTAQERIIHFREVYLEYETEASIGEASREVDEYGMTSWPGVFDGGDAVHGADLIVTALRDGRDAAREIDRYLRSL